MRATPAMQRAQYANAEPARDGPVDERRSVESVPRLGRSEIGQHELKRLSTEHRRRIDVQDVEVHPARRRIRTLARRIARADRVHRAEGERVGAAMRERFRRACKRFVVADTAAACAPQRIDLRGDTV